MSAELHLTNNKKQKLQMKTKSIFLLLTVALSLFACNEEYPELEDGMYAQFNTSMGPIVAELYFEETPMTVASFVSLAEGNGKMADSTHKGKKYYDGLVFHRIIDGFMIQGGDPTGTGSGGPGYKFPDEFVDSLGHDSKGDTFYGKCWSRYQRKSVFYHSGSGRTTGRKTYRIR